MFSVQDEYPVPDRRQMLFHGLQKLCEQAPFNSKEAMGTIEAGEEQASKFESCEFSTAGRSETLQLAVRPNAERGSAVLRHRKR